MRRKKNEFAKVAARAGLAQRKLNRLPARERIDLLIDPVKRENRRFPNNYLELNLWSAHGMYQEVGGTIRPASSPSLAPSTPAPA